MMTQDTNYFGRRFGALLLATVLLSLFSVKSFGQGRVSNYTTTTFSGTLQSISSTGTALGEDDDSYYTFQCPFSFVYDSVTYAGGSTWAVGDNGICNIGNATGDGCCGSWVGSSSYASSALIYSTDLYHYSGNNYYQVTGTAPNRVLTVEEYRISGYGNSSETTTLQYKFYETSNVIEFWYGDYSYAMTGSDNSGSYGIGLNGTSTGGFTYLLYQGNASGSSSSTIQTPSANVRFTPPPPPNPPAEVSVQPKSLSFGSLLTGQKDTMCVTITDVGPNLPNATPLRIVGLGLSGVSDYTLLTAAPGPMTPGQSATVCISFAPIASGGRSGTLNVMTNARDSANQSVSLIGYGIAPGISVGGTYLFRRTPAKLATCITQSLPISSTGSGPLTIDSITIGGYWPGQYSITRMPMSVIPSGTTDTLKVSYCPTLEGLHSGTLYIASNALNQPFDTLQMTGIGTLPRLVVTPQPLNFDSVGIGSTQCDSVMLWNPGTDTVIITRNYLSSGDGDFSLSPLMSPDTIIPPDARRYVKICYTPLSRGDRQARLRLTTNIPLTFDSPSRDTSAFTAEIIGVGVPFGILSVGGTAIVDSSIIGQKICSTDTLYNRGYADLTVTGATLNGANGSEYSLSTIPFPIVIHAGSYYVFTVCATPSARGDRNATLTVTGTTSGQALTSSLSLDVYGLLVCASTTPSDAFRKSTCLGLSDTANVIVTNCGDAASAYTASLSSGATEYAIVPPTSTPVVNAAGNATFMVAFTPTTPGASPATLTITGGTGVTPMTVSLSGVGAAATIAGNGTAPTTKAGSTSDQFSVIVQNTGECEWSPGVPTVDSLFTYVSGANPIPPGGSDTLIFTFSPKNVGTFTESLHFPNASGATTAPAVVTISGSATLLGVGRTTAADGFSLEQNYPNPFNPTTEIRFMLPKESEVRLDIMDLSGRIVRTVLSERMSAGSHGTVVDASDLSSGVYYYTLTAGSVKLTRQMILTR